MNFKTYDLNKLKILIYTGSIIDDSIKVDALTNSINADLQFNHAQSLAKAFLMKFGSKIVKSCHEEAKLLYRNQKISYGECICTPTGLNSSPKYIMNVITPFLNDYNFIALLNKSFENLFSKANSLNDVKSLALPLIATGINQAPHDLCADILKNSILTFIEKTKSFNLKEIHLINMSQNKTDILIKIFDDLFKDSSLSNMIKSEPKQEDLNNKDNGNKVIYGLVSKTDEPVSCEFCKQRVKNVFTLDKCKHMYCLGCTINLEENDFKCLSQKCEKSKKPDEDESKSNKPCEICFETDNEIISLDKCKHQLCKKCYEKQFELKPQCPFCLVFYEIPKGTQPKNGNMKYRKHNFNLPGFDNVETYVIEYYIPSGIQESFHPSPGKAYNSISRQAYLPANEKGTKALKLLGKAFENRLIFTIGISRTTGKETITWNDIHHKTELSGPYGYPDSDYLDRLLDELKANGIE